MTRADTSELRKQLRGGGYLPIPIIGKKPAMTQWQIKVATNDAEIELWSRVYPHAESTGLLTQKMPVLDIDITVPDAAAAVELLARGRFEEHGSFLVRFGAAPKRAIPFKCDKPFKKITANLIAPDGDTEQKLELLADGQQVVGFGIHESTNKRYQWFGGEPGEVRRDQLPAIAEAEAQQLVEDAVELLVCEHGYQRAASRPKLKSKENGYDQGAADWGYLVENIRAGHELHDSLRDLAAKLIKSGMSAGAVVNFLYAAMDASTAPHDSRWQERRDDIPRLVKSAEAKLMTASPEVLPADITAAFTFLGDAPATPPRELIKDLIPAFGVCVTGGQSSAGKTFVEIHKAVCLANGLPFFGRRIVERVGTVFIPAEGRALIPNRFAASLAHNKITRKLPISWIKQLPDFSSLEGIKRLEQQLKEMDKRYQGDFGARLGQVTIDTVAACFSMKSEDDNAEATKISNICRAIGETIGALITPVHHYGKNPESGLRGASAWKGSADGVLGVLADIDPLSGRASDREAVCTKARDGEQGPLSAFDLEFVQLGLNADDEPYGSVCVVPTEGKSRFDKTAGLSKSQRALQNALDEAMDSTGKYIIPRAGMPPVKAVKVTTVRQEFDRRYVVDDADPAKSANAKRMAFKRSLDHLSASKFGAGAAEGTDWIWKIT
jgi:hypothetical protein